MQSMKSMKNKVLIVVRRAQGGDEMTTKVTEQAIRQILGSYVDAIDRVDAREWCAWIGGIGYPIYSLAQARALARQIEEPR